MIDAASIARATHGIKAGAGWLINCPAVGHTDTKASCSVRDGDRGPVFHCFAGCDWRDVRAGARARGWLPRIEGSDRLDPETARKRLAASYKTSSTRLRQEIAEEARRVALAQQIWMIGVESSGTPAETYLRSRGISLPIPACLRFAARVWHPYAKVALPAMVASIENPLTGEFQGIHATFLHRDGHRKADVSPAKLMRGKAGGGVVRLACVSQFPDHLALAEGIESALSYQQLTGVPAWAALSAGNFGKVRWPVGVKRVTLAADHDAPGLAEAEKATPQWVLAGFDVEISKPSRLGSDFNDLLREREVVDHE